MSMHGKITKLHIGPIKLQQYLDRTGFSKFIGIFGCTIKMQLVEKNRY